MTEQVSSGLRPLNYRLYAAVRALVSPLTLVYFRIHITGVENIPAPGTPAIVTVNHASTLDVPITGYAIGRPAYFAAKYEITRWPVIGPLLNRMGAVAARRERSDTDAVRLLKAALEGGGLIGLAPEGTRSRDGRLGRYDPGFAWLASRTGAVVVPAAIHGARELMPKNTVIPRPGPLWMRFGQPMSLPATGGRPNRDDLNDFAAAVRGRTIELLGDLAAESGIPSPATDDLD